MSRYVQALSIGEVAVLDTLRGIQKRYGKKYCFPSQDTILEFLEKFHHIRICKRTLNYWLAKLVRKGLIYRHRRLTRASFRTTAYYLLDRGGFGVVKAKKLIGTAKRLASVLPSRMQKIANDKDTANIRHSGGRPGKKAAPAPVKALRCETSDQMKGSSAPGSSGAEPKEGKEPQEGGAVRACMDLVRSLNRSRLLRRGS